MQVHLNLDWESIATFAAAFLGLISGVLGTNHFKENWSLTTRYRELRLLRSHESKVKEMNSASSYRVKEAFASSVKYDDCRLEQYRFARELKNPRKNLKLAEERASLPGSLMFESILACTFLVIYADGVFVLSGVLRRRSYLFFILVVLAWSCLSAVVWSLLTKAIKQYCWNEAIKYCFNDFLKPVFQESEASSDTQDEFKEAIRSFHSIYDNNTMVSLKKACSRILVTGLILLVLASFVNTVLADCLQRKYLLWSYSAFLTAMILIAIVFLCCLLTYYSKLQELKQKEKEKYPWYNPLIDANHARHCKILNKTYEFGYWVGETIGKSKKHEE